MLTLVTLLSLAGCYTGTEEYRRNFSDYISARNTAVVAIDIERGNAVYSNTGPADVNVDGISYGRGYTYSDASFAEAGNSWSLYQDRDVTHWLSNSRYTEAGVDVSIGGPFYTSVDALITYGDLDVRDASGTHYLSAEYIDTSRLEGEADIYIGYTGADLEIWPYIDGVINIESDGFVTLRLPAYGPYDIEVYTPRGAYLAAANLGFDDFTLYDGYFRGYRFPGTTIITVYVNSAGFELLESY